MRQDAFARRTGPAAEPASAVPAEASAKTEYDALCAALGATARGRAFLDEHARRARQKDTALALQALSRLEEQLRNRAAASDGAARFHGELRALRSAIVSARTNVTRFEGMLAKRETVMALFDMLELRITEMLAEGPLEAEPQAANENELLAAAETQATLAAAETRAALIDVQTALATVEPSPPPAPRELHIEAPVELDLPEAIAPVESRAPEPQAPTVLVPEPQAPKIVVQEPPAPTVVVLEPRPHRDAHEKQSAAALPVMSELESFPEEIFAPPPRPAPAVAPQQNIIALINALTQAEKIALFS